MPLQIFTIDAFAHEPFSGNPAATVKLDDFPSDRLMKQIAMEMNLSETAFAKRLAPNYFHLRWFTPTQEVKLCGHATLAMAHYLREIGEVDLNLPLQFHTLSGRLLVSFEGSLLVMNFPAAHPVPCSERSLALLPEIIGDQPYECLGLTDNVTVVLAEEAAVQKFVPDFAKIAQLEIGRLNITAIADQEHPYDFVSRFFAPTFGINEDPVTGSAHCTLTPYWAKRLGKNILKAKQLSQRTGELEVVYEQDRVLIKGYAVTVLRGSLDITQ